MQNDFFDALEAAKKGLSQMDASVEEMKENIRILREGDLKRRGAQAELKWRLNRFWRDGEDPGDPVNWRGRRGFTA